MRIIFNDGEVMDDIFTLTAIGNGKFCGGGYCATPLADMQDGIMDICAIKKISKLNLITLVGSYKSGEYLNNKRALKYIRHKRASSFRMEFDEPIPICIDGEIKGVKSVDFSVVPNAFNFVVPNGSAFID